MVRAGGRVRSGRSAPVVVVTAAGPAAGAAAVVRVLADRVGAPGGPGRVLAVDTDVPGEPGEPGTPALVAELAGADVVVHVATPTDLAADLRTGATRRRARAVRAVQDVAAAAAAVGARRLVVVTSAMVYGARPDNPAPLPEDAPLRAPRDEGVVGDLLEVERIVARLPRIHPGLACTVLRPAPLVGAGVDTFVTRHFGTPRLLALRGHEMIWQFCHLEDLGTAVAAAVEHDLDGVLTVGCLPGLPAEAVARLTGMRRTELPAGLAFRTAERLHRHGLLATPAGYLAYVVHPWVVGAQRLVEVGWRPRFSAEDCLRALLDESRTAAGGPTGDDLERLHDGPPGARRVEPRDAALGAAGAAVAVVGAAALLRQARLRRTGGSRRLR